MGGGPRRAAFRCHLDNPGAALYPAAMATITAAPNPVNPVAGESARIPPLENGDRLTRAEFERRYAAMPRLKKAELIEGIVHMPSPVHLSRHAKPHAQLIGWLHHYEAATPGVELADNATVRLDLDNEPQPDVILRILPKAGGQSGDSPDDYVVGAPELIAEVASSSAAYDLHEKKRAYRRNGVREYLVWLVDETRVEWWELQTGEYVDLPTEDGVLKSRVFPGLWLDAQALVLGESAKVLAQLQRGLATSEHAAFAAGLRSRLSA
jgi:Uma2 family endonuclease